MLHRFSSILTFPQGHLKGSGSGPPPGWPSRLRIDEISIRCHRIEANFVADHESDGLEVALGVWGSTFGGQIVEGQIFDFLKKVFLSFLGPGAGPRVTKDIGGRGSGPEMFF